MSTLAPTPPSEPRTERPDAERVPSELLESARRGPLLTGRVTGQNAAAYILILLGLLFLVATFVPLGGGVFLLGLGLAFFVARLTSGHYGYAVPAGILVGLGAFVAFQQSGVLPDEDGGWALIFLGLGFFAVYPLGGRLGAYWPLIPGAILLALGLIQIGMVAMEPLASYAWIGRYWPVVLVLLGLWILARDSMSRPVRLAVGVVLVTTLILGGVLALAATMAASVGPGTASIGLPGSIGDQLSALGPTTTLSEPIGDGQALRITNQTGGTTQVVAGDAGIVRARVIRQVGLGPPAIVELSPMNGGVVLEARSAGSWPNQSPSVSLIVEAPRNVTISIQTSSGDVVVVDRAAAVQIDGSSSNLTVTRVDGPARLQTSSGSIRVADVTGDLNVRSSSGSIDARGLLHPRNAQTSSGSITLSGTFGDVARVQSSSGDVTLWLSPDSSTRITATTSSGTVSTGALALTGINQAQHNFAGTLGAGVGTLTITTSSGNIRLDAAR